MCVVTETWICLFRLLALDCERCVNRSDVSCSTYCGCIYPGMYNNLKSLQTATSFQLWRSLSLVFFFAFIQKIMQPTSIVTTRFNSFTDGLNPSVWDSVFVVKLFTDGLTDGNRLSASLSSVIPPPVAISVGKNNCQWFYRRKMRTKKKFPLDIYRQILFRRWLWHIQ